jgi:hypothetical protein
MLASQNNYVEVVRTLLAAKADVNARDGVVGETALMVASSYGHVEVVQALLAAKADVNVKAANGDTALMMASKQGQLEVVRVLLIAKADVNAKTADGQTAMSQATTGGYAEIVRLLKAGPSTVSQGSGVFSEKLYDFNGGLVDRAIGGTILERCLAIQTVLGENKSVTRTSRCSDGTVQYRLTPASNGTLVGFKFGTGNVKVEEELHDALKKALAGSR